MSHRTKDTVPSQPLPNPSMSGKLLMSLQPDVDEEREDRVSKLLEGSLEGVIARSRHLASQLLYREGVNLADLDDLSTLSTIPLRFGYKRDEGNGRLGTIVPIDSPIAKQKEYGPLELAIIPLKALHRDLVDQALFASQARLSHDSLEKSVDWVNTVVFGDMNVQPDQQGLTPENLNSIQERLQSYELQLLEPVLWRVMLIYCNDGLNALDVAEDDQVRVIRTPEEDLNLPPTERDMAVLLTLRGLRAAEQQKDENAQNLVYQRIIDECPMLTINYPGLPPVEISLLEFWTYYLRVSLRLTLSRPRNFSESELSQLAKKVIDLSLEGVEISNKLDAQHLVRIHDNIHNSNRPEVQATIHYLANARQSTTP